MAMEKWNVEYTDTFAGEANYSWVRRATIEVLPLERDCVYTSAVGAARARRAYFRDIVRQAKAAVGLTGDRGRMYNHGDYFEFRPYNSCTVMFITYADC